MKLVSVRLYRNMSSSSRNVPSCPIHTLLSLIAWTSITPSFPISSSSSMYVSSSASESVAGRRHSRNAVMMTELN